MQSCAGIILSGGESRRMGSPKALLRFSDGKTLLATQIELFNSSGLDRVVVVVGAHSEEIRSQCDSLNCIWIDNSNWKLGQFSSIQAGIAAAGAMDALILPVDCVGIKQSTIATILEAAFKNTRFDAIIPTNRGQTGHPVYLSKEFCRKLSKLNPSAIDARLDRQLLSAATIEIEVDDKGITKNVNTMDEFYQHGSG